MDFKVEKQTAFYSAHSFQSITKLLFVCNWENRTFYFQLGLLILHVRASQPVSLSQMGICTSVCSLITEGGASRHSRTGRGGKSEQMCAACAFLHLFFQLFQRVCAGALYHIYAHLSICNSSGLLSNWGNLQIKYKYSKNILWILWFHDGIEHLIFFLFFFIYLFLFARISFSMSKVKFLLCHKWAQNCGLKISLFSKMKKSTYVLQTVQCGK